jgi:hypothetical protein
LLNYQKENEKVELMSYCGAVNFLINNFQDVVHVNNNDVDMNEALESTLVSITYSTLRGMIVLRTLGTPLAQFILPIINPMILVESRKKSQEQNRNN